MGRRDWSVQSSFVRSGTKNICFMRTEPQQSQQFPALDLFRGKSSQGDRREPRKCLQTPRAIGAQKVTGFSPLSPSTFTYLSTAFICIKASRNAVETPIKVTMDDTMDDILRKFRNKWCDDLEDMLQCPICMLCTPNISIYQCIEGHHICQNCKPRLPNCPTCGKHWALSRNRLAENMCSKFEDIKSSLIDPEAKINELLIPDKFCVATQTDNVNVADAVPLKSVVATVTEPETVVATVVTATTPKPALDMPSGLYPCCISNCKAEMGFVPLMMHVKSDHPLHFMESPLGCELFFEHTWLIVYLPNTTFDRIFRIDGVGVFALKVSMDPFGSLKGYVIMIHCGVTAKLFSYQLKINDGEKFPAYMDNVYSCRSPAETFNGNCLSISFMDLLQHEHGYPLKCTLLLARKLDDMQTLKINQAKKTRGKNNNNKIRKQSVAF